MGEREGLTKCHLRSRCRTLLPHSHALANAYLGFFPCFFLTCFFFSLLPNLLKVMQRARPSFNPKGTCPRWAESPAAPGGHKRRTRQFHSTRERGKMVSVALFLCKCSSQSIHLHRGRTRVIFLAVRMFSLHCDSPPLLRSLFCSLLQGSRRNVYCLLLTTS
jgi:hypothetical protein